MPEDDELPVPPLEDDEPKRNRSHPEKGSPEAMAIGQRLAAARKAKRAAAKDDPPKAPKDAGRNDPGAPPPSSGELKALREELADSCRDLGALVGPIAPTPGVYLLETGEVFATAVTRAAEHNPKLLAYLQRSTSYTAYLAIGSWLAGLGVAVWAETSGGQVPMTIAERWGIDRMYLSTHEVAEPGPSPEGEPVEDGEGAFSIASVPAPSFLGGDRGASEGAVAAG